MKKTLFLLLPAVFVVPFLSGYPKPTLIPKPGLLTLDVRFEKPRQIKLKLEGDEQPTRFWYMILTLTNKSGSEVPFYPSAYLVTDTFQVINAGTPVSDILFEKISRIHEGGYPFLQSIDKTDRRILQGEDNAVDVLVIWPDFGFRAKNISFMIEGLGNETAVVLHPTEKDENGNPVRIFLRKTLELNYNVPGDSRLREDIQPVFNFKRWVMR